MEYLEGQTLRALVYKKKLTPERAVDIMLPGAFVLAVAHERGIIHRDIKPENIFLDVHHGHEVVKVLDFGLAAFREELEGKTREETVKGSPSYLSPERVAGIPSDGRADVYAAGCVLFEMLCGRPPFIREAGQSAAELASSHILKLAPEVSDFNPDVPEALVRLVAETLEKKPANRLTSSRFALRLAAVRDAMGSPPAR
jgi:serine/threonine protein kinase